MTQHIIVMRLDVICKKEIITRTHSEGIDLRNPKS